MSQLKSPDGAGRLVWTARESESAGTGAADAGAAGALPRALLVGPMKAGTSWLHAFLKTHAQVTLPRGVKETFYFDRRYQRKPLRWYAAHFPREAADGALTVEVAPTYFHPPEVPQRVVETLGPIPVVVTLREPAARAFSLFQHMRRYGYTSCRTFRSAVQRHPEILQSSQYSAALRRWERAVGEPNVKVLWMEQLQADPLRFARACCEALGIDARIERNALPGPVNVACRPRWRAVAWTGRAFADALRSHRLYAVVDYAKRCGIKRWFFGAPARSGESITESDRRWFLGLIEDDLRWLERRFERQTSHWLDRCR